MLQVDTRSLLVCDYLWQSEEQSLAFKPPQIVHAIFLYNAVVKD